MQTGTSPAGLPAEDWVLRGPYSDKTLIRNHLAYTLTGTSRARAPRFVEVAVNGDRGVYVDGEDRGTSRVDLLGGAGSKRDWVEGGPEFIETERCEDILKVDWPDSTAGVLRSTPWRPPCCPRTRSISTASWTTCCSWSWAGTSMATC